MILLLVCPACQMELLDICKFPMLEQLPDEFNPPPFPCVGLDIQTDTRGPLVTLTESAAGLLELHLPISFTFVVCFLC